MPQKDRSETLREYLNINHELVNSHCNLFLDTIIENVSYIDYRTLLLVHPELYTLAVQMDAAVNDSGNQDAQQVVLAAQEIKAKMNEVHPIQSLLEYTAEETGWKLLEKGGEALKEELGLTSGGWLLVLKKSMGVADKVFRITDKFKVADNIRFVSILSNAMRSGVASARRDYLGSGSEESAAKYMQLLSFLIDLRMIGESQVAQLGISYEILPGTLDSWDLFMAVREMSGVSEATSWLEWRDAAEDQLSLVRVTLLRNPVSKQAFDLTAPVVTFDYASGQTAQSFDDSYEYRIGSSGAWTTCSGQPISVPAYSYPVELQVRRVTTDATGGQLTTRIMVYGAQPLYNTSLLVRKTASGYRVENLDHERTL